ncbi:magnesium-transporting ATPase (P-type) [Chryseobacterium defluvii]|uniref:Magnesium-transporting ATPase (P-type) n=1 Tax=Chryseobacterium defluvii TaxID=160396 RepID=A0A840KGQ3_9FLAO|nr:DUF3667 domain-containing protein [Chryseobacterium defluvii]MBB4807855.1 magnesium-transporting ATPase (P-type) [Chryseobacterium defluvii]
MYSVKNILKNPGKTAKEYIDGNRVNHYKPILLVFVLSGIATFISYKILNLKEVMSAYFSQQHLNSNFMNDMMSLMSSYNSILMLLLVPFFALTTKIAFRKWGHNYYEHVVMNAYILSFYTLVSIILVYPIMFIFRHSPNAFFTITQLSALLIPLILVWFFREFYKARSLKSIIFRVIGVLGLTILGYLLLLVFVGVAGAVFSILKGPESLEYLKSK